MDTLRNQELSTIEKRSEFLETVQYLGNWFENKGCLVTLKVYSQKYSDTLSEAKQTPVLLRFTKYCYTVQSFHPS